MNNDGRVFDRLFGPSEPPSVSSVGERASDFLDLYSDEALLSGVVETPQVDVQALIRAIDKLEASVARLRRFLMVDERGVVRCDCQRVAGHDVACAIYQ